MRYQNTYALVLAAGKGTRMKSDKAKVLHEAFYAPMIYHVLDAVVALGLEKTIVVTGHQKAELEGSLQSYDVLFAWQEKQLGTGHAVLAAEEILAGRKGTVLILCGDTPLIRAETLGEMLEKHVAGSSALTVMTTTLDDPSNYGRILADAAGNVLKIVEEKDASASEKDIKEINAGIYCIDTSFLFSALKTVGTENSQGEMYLTDIVEIAKKQEQTVQKFHCADAEEVLGVNSRVELAQAHRVLQQRRNRELMLSGVTMVQPETISIEKKVTIGRDTLIQPNVVITGLTSIGTNCAIGPFAFIRDCRIGNGVKVGPFSCLEEARLVDEEEALPYESRVFRQ